ncbi:MAG: hypothetical protein SPL05_08060 [Eubacteriales bacterium]|nr:hypothetical protein [Eubacteriales bacterium]
MKKLLSAVLVLSLLLTMALPFAHAEEKVELIFGIWDKNQQPGM